MISRKHNPNFINNSVEEIHDYNIDIEHREVFLHSYINNGEQENGTDYRMSAYLIKNLRYLDAQKQADIVIHQHNIGGDYTHGMSIYDAILACRSHIAIICYGEASSMGSIILQAADLRLAMPNCYFMIHCMSLGTEYCPIKSYKSYGDFSSKLNNNMLNIYVNRFYETGSFFKGKTKKYIRQYIENKLNSKLDWYLTAEEALNLGLIDGIIDNTHQIDKICKLN